MEVLNVIANHADKLGFYYLTILCFFGALAYTGKITHSKLKVVAATMAALGLITLLINDFFGDADANHIVLVLAAASFYMLPKKPLETKA